MEPCGSILCYSFRANRRAIGHAECSRTPSPFGYSLYKQRESYHAVRYYSSSAF